MFLCDAIQKWQYFLSHFYLENLYFSDLPDFELSRRTLRQHQSQRLHLKSHILWVGTSFNKYYMTIKKVCSIYNEYNPDILHSCHCHVYSKVSMITENSYISFHTFYLVDAYLDAANISHYLTYHNLNALSYTNKTMV